MLLNLQRAGANLTEYNDPAGLWGLRKAIAQHLGAARGISVMPEQILVVAGSQEALNIAARLLIKEGTPVVIECPAYQGAASVFDSYGADLIPVKVDEDGIIIENLPADPVSLAYLTPSHQYPLGMTLSLKRRVQLLEWATEVGAYLLEDDYDSDFRHNSQPLTALKGLDRHNTVIYVGTFSKSIGAALRLGYMVLPPELLAQAIDVKTLLNNSQPWLDQAVVADFLTQGHFNSHLRRIRRTYLARRECLVAALQAHFGPVRLSGLEGGMHVVWHLPPDFPPAAEFVEQVRVQGVGIYSLAAGAAYCDPDEAATHSAIMLGYSSLTEQEIREGIKRIANALGKPGLLPSTKDSLSRRNELPICTQQSRTPLRL